MYHYAQLESSFFFLTHCSKNLKTISRALSMVSESGVDLCFEEHWNLNWNFIGNNNQDKPILDEDSERKNRKRKGL